MNLQVPAVIKEQLVGEPEEDWKPIRSTQGDRDHAMAKKRVAELLKLGIFKRAIVCGLYKYGQDRLDPLNWGIVVDVDPYQVWPLKIRWADGAINWYSGMNDGVSLIYKGISASDLDQKLKATTH